MQTREVSRDKGQPSTARNRVLVGRACNGVRQGRLNIVVEMETLHIT
jgi:hypothetical protein